MSPVMLAARQAGIIAPAIEKDYYVTLLLSRHGVRSRQAAVTAYFLQSEQ